MPNPPAASLAVDGGDPVEGELGSFTLAERRLGFALATGQPDPRRQRASH